MERVTECEELLDRCAEVARGGLSLGDVLAVLGFAALLIAVWFVLRRVPARRDGGELAIHSRYQERVQYLQALKSGRLWGDIGMTEPDDALPPPTRGS